jgi:hypothetical protein
MIPRSVPPGAGEPGGPGHAAAATCKRPATSAGERRLHEPILDLLEERTVRRPFRVPQAWRRMHCRNNPEPLELRPERVIIGMVLPGALVRKYDQTKQFRLNANIGPAEESRLDRRVRQWRPSDDHR